MYSTSIAPVYKMGPFVCSIYSTNYIICSYYLYLKVAVMVKCSNMKKESNFKTKKSFSVSENNFDGDPRL